ncbi:MAG: Fic/DOC family N-terminal domain-containing protein [Fimbriimonadales bacterium]|nr:MAG: cell filamentation protein Fic [Fimbriimonadales bacterium]
MRAEQFSKETWGRLIRVGSGKGSYWAYAPNPLPPPLQYDSELISALSAADRALGELSGLGRALPNPYLLARPLTAREAVLSSRIEGTQAELLDLYVYESGHQARTGAAVAPDTREVYQYIQAMEHALNRLRELPVSLRLIQETHRVLMEGMRGGYTAPGEFRTVQNWIGAPGCPIDEARFVPPPPDEMRQCLYQLENYLHAENSHPPLVRLALIHYQFEAIHPFLDGNGRMGRLLIILLMVHWGLLPSPLLYLSEYFERHRQAYYDLLLTVSTEARWRDWLLFFLHGVREQSIRAVETLRAIQSLQEGWRALVANAGVRSAVVARALELLIERPVLTARVLQQAAHCSHVAANSALAQLQELGILSVQGASRPRLYVAHELLRLLQSPM